MVNRAFVRAFWPGEEESAVGRTVGLVSDVGGTWYTITGVVGDHRQNGLTEPAGPMLYIPHREAPWMPRLHIVARTAGPAAPLASALREAIWDIDPGLPIPSVELLSDRVRASVAEPTFYAGLLSLFAWIALGLALVGVYGTMSFIVGRRTKEMGIRVALGAPTTSLRRLLVARELAVVAVGILAGIGGAIVFSRLLTQFMYGVTPSDPATLLTAAAVLAAGAALACYLPARRATRVDPVRTLRED